MGIPVSDYARMAERVARLSHEFDAVHPSVDAVEHEGDLHNQILDECRRRGWIAFHGSMAKATARTLGEPDFTILADGGRKFFVECKSKTGKLSLYQIALIM